MNSPTVLLSQSQVREVLQYVPLFQNETFVVAFDGGMLSDSALAEILLDLLALQKIGVKLVIAYFGEERDDFFDWATEIELKLSRTSPEKAAAVLSRGQAAFLALPGSMSFRPTLARLSLEVQAQKVLYLASQEALPDYLEGAVNVLDARELSLAVQEPSHFEAAIELVEEGVSRVHLLDAEMPGCLSRELFSNEGVGVMIYGDSYREIRGLSEEDIPELLAIIGRSVRSQHLLPRSYEEIEQQLEDYFVMTIDGNVVGCIALHPYEVEKEAEIACLFVKPSHAGLGYGRELVEHAELTAKERGISDLFALSSSAGGFFERHLGYEPIALSQIPKTRYQKLSESGRDSTALRKTTPSLQV